MATQERDSTLPRAPCSSGVPQGVLSLELHVSSVLGPSAGVEGSSFCKPATTPSLSISLGDVAGLPASGGDVRVEAEEG